MGVGGRVNDVSSTLKDAVPEHTLEMSRTTGYCFPRRVWGITKNCENYGTYIKTAWEEAV